jgi:hypothetical protein
MTDDDLQAIEQRAEKATAGPWEQLSGKYMCLDQGLHPQRFVSFTQADEEFVLAARTDVPRLCAALREARELLREVPDWSDVSLAWLTKRDALLGKKEEKDGK